MPDSNKFGVFTPFAEAVDSSRNIAKNIIRRIETKEATWKSLSEITSIDGITVLHIISLVSGRTKNAAAAELKEMQSERGRNAAQARHALDNQRTEAIQAEWATGKYPTKSACAQLCWKQLGFGRERTAREALFNAPDPPVWPAKKRHSPTR